MKQLILTCFCAFALQTLQAQTTSGTIMYGETVKMNFNLKDEDIQMNGVSAQQLAALLPKEQSISKVLYYTTDGVLYDAVKQEKTDATTEGGNGSMRMVIMHDDSKSYHDLKGKKLIEQQDFMNRKFLVTSDLGKIQWKMTGKQKEILGYPCQQAVAEEDSQKITAWYTPAIPISAGPRGLDGLPGMILEAEIGAQLTIAATKVTPGDVNPKLLVKPSEGKKVSKEQYEKIVAEKRKEMQAEGGGNGNIIIRTEVRH